MQEKTRKYLYAIGAAVVAVLVGYGVVGEGDSALWLGLLGAVLAVGELSMAAAHTGTGKRKPAQVELSVARRNYRR